MQLHDKSGGQKSCLKQEIGQEHFVNPDMKAIKENSHSEAQDTSLLRLCETQNFHRLCDIQGSKIKLFLKILVGYKTEGNK